MIAFHKERFSQWSKGFSLLEIIIVMSIIGILVVLAIIMVPGAINRSRGVAIATSLEQTHRAMVAWHLANDWDQWVTEETLGFPYVDGLSPHVCDVPGNSNPKLSDIIVCPPSKGYGLDKYLNKEDIPGDFIGNTRYDNDDGHNTLANPCSGEYEDSINLQIIASQYFEYVDDIIDHGDGQCGRVTNCKPFGYNCIAYRLSFEEDDVSDSLKTNIDTAQTNAAKIIALSLPLTDLTAQRKYTI
jgi:prepilin-type N-terminal cleavage/methylation domain-containing protein